MKILIGLVALVLSVLAVVHMLSGDWGRGFLCLGLAIGAVFLIPEDSPLRHKGSIHFFGK